MVDVVMESQRHRARFDERQALGHELFGAQWRELHSDWDQLRALCDWSAALHRAVEGGELPAGVVDYLNGAPSLPPAAFSNGSPQMVHSGSRSSRTPCRHAGQQEISRRSPSTAEHPRQRSGKRISRKASQSSVLHIWPIVVMILLVCIPSQPLLHHLPAVF